MDFRKALLVLILAGGLAGCGSDSKQSSQTGRPLESTSSTSAAAPTGCSKEVEEVLDSDSSKHVLPGAEEPRYRSDPPTSGPHQLGKHPTGDLSNPIARPIQVAMLERGDVLIQYRDPSVRPQLAALLEDHVAVAPNPSLNAPIVLTAWVHKIECTSLDSAAITGFIDSHAGRSEHEGGH